MKPNSGKPDRQPEEKRKSALTFVLVLFLQGFSLAFLPSMLAQQKQAAKPASPSQTELVKRLKAASDARDSHDEAAVARANERLIAQGLREMAHLKLVEADDTQAIDLYNNSLSFEEDPDTRIDLAIAELQAGHFDNAIEQTEKALATDPNSIRASHVLGSAFIQKGDYTSAAGPLTRLANAEPSIENLYSLAIDLLSTGKADDKLRAVEVFERMKKTAGDSGSLHVLFGRAYRDAGDMPSALKEFQRAVALDPHTIHAHYFLGLAQLSMNEWKPTPGAEADLRTEAEYFPHDYLANYMLGFITSGERNYEESDKYLLAASKISPAAPEPFLYMGLNAFSQERMDVAEKMLRRAVELTGSDEARANYQIRRAYVDLARILARGGRNQESDAFAAKARALQNKTMVESQQSVSAIMLAGGTGAAAAVVPLSRQQEDQAAPSVGSGADLLAHSKLSAEQRTAAESSEKMLRSVLALAFNDLATSQVMQGGYSLALSNYQQAEQWDRTLPDLEKNLGQCAFRAKNYAEAARGLSLALAHNDGSPALRAMLGVSYFATDQFVQAAQTFAPLGERAMEDSETGYPWAASLTHIGDMKKATEVLSAFESQPRPNDTLLLVGQLWTEIGDYARAIATLQRALASDPSLLKAHFYEGLAYIRWEHWPEAAKEFQAELILDPGDPHAQYHLGFVYLEQSKTDDAAALFLKVIAEHPDHANAQYELGKILLDRGQTADAAGHLEAAARLSPQTDYMHYQLQAAYRKMGRDADADRELEIYKGLKTKSRERVADQLKQNP
jgi:tetratricopeptide (TPR) repeat protein